MGGQEKAYVAQAFEENFIAPAGPHIPAFEKEFAAYLGRGFCAALSSGTAALHLCLRLLDVGPGDEVLCSDLTFIASASPIVFVGAGPVFVDADPKTWNLDANLLADLLKDRKKRGKVPKALVLVHLYGLPADVGAISKLCREYGVSLIEDAAESLGATYDDQPTGTFGRFGVFSFNGNKIITSGGGGMLFTEDRELAEKARFLATQARDEAPHYEHSVIGYNYRMGNIPAGIGRGQLKVLDLRIKQKQRVFQGYKERLGNLPEITFMPEPGYGKSTFWLSCVTFGEDEKSGFQMREAVRLALEAENIEARPLWKPMHMQPVFKDADLKGGAVGEDLFLRGLCLPSGTQLNESDQDRICEIVRRALGGL